MLDYARAGDTVVVAAVDRLGRSVAEVTRTIADLGERQIMLRTLREGSTPPLLRAAPWQPSWRPSRNSNSSSAGSAAPRPGIHAVPGNYRRQSLQSSAPIDRSSCGAWQLPVNRSPSLLPRLGLDGPLPIDISPIVKQGNRMPEPSWNLGVLTGVAQVLADTHGGLTGYEIGQLLGRLDMDDPGAGLTKWKRLEEAFVRRQNTDGHPQRIITFITHAMNPANYIGRPELFTLRQDQLDEVLTFVGLRVEDTGKVHRGPGPPP